MRIIRKAMHRVRTLIRPRRFERDLDEELSFHLEMQTRWHESQGLDRTTAHALATRPTAIARYVRHRWRRRNK